MSIYFLSVLWKKDNFIADYLFPDLDTLLHLVNYLSENYDVAFLDLGKKE